MLYALVSPAGDVIGHQRFDAVPEGLDVLPHKPRYLPIVGEEAPAHDARTHVLEGPMVEVTEHAVTWTWNVRAKNPEEVSALRAARINDIKAQAAARILALYPEWKQRNMTSRAVVLLRIALDRSWTPEEAAESDALKSAWGAVDAIRTRSNELEAAIPSDAAGIAAFDPSDGWD